MSAIEESLGTVDVVVPADRAPITVRLGLMPVLMRQELERGGVLINEEALIQRGKDWDAIVTDWHLYNLRTLGSAGIPSLWRKKDIMIIIPHIVFENPRGGNWVMGLQEDESQSFFDLCLFPTDQGFGEKSFLLKQVPILQ